MNENHQLPQWLGAIVDRWLISNPPVSRLSVEIARMDIATMSKVLWFAERRLSHRVSSCPRCKWYGFTNGVVNGVDVSWDCQECEVERLVLSSIRTGNTDEEGETNAI